MNHSNPSRAPLYLNRYRRELAVLFAYGLLLGLAAIVAPSFFSAANWRDLGIANAPVLILAVGMTLVILVAEIDISVGSQFAVCSLAAAWLAKAGVPMVLLVPCALVIGAGVGAINGVLVARLRLPSIIVTLAMLAAWRNASQWITEGAWVQDLPGNFQWFGLSQHAGESLIFTVALAVFLVF